MLPVKNPPSPICSQSAKRKLSSIQASEGMDASKQLEVVRDVLGHSTVKPTERYAHLQVERQEKALIKLSRMVNP